MSPPRGGLFCPITTPFGGDGVADPDRLVRQIETYADTPLAGIVMFGTSGEGPMLMDEERGILLKAAREAVPTGWRIIVQVGRESAPAAAAAARTAADEGADSLLCLPPRYYPCGREELADYYRAVEAASSLPLLAYHIPQRTHVDLPAALLVELAREGVLDGIKDSAGDLDLQSSLRRDAGPEFEILNGMAGVLLDALDGVADGAVLAVADAVPETAHEVFRAHAAGDRAAAADAQDALRPLAECFGPRFGVSGIKAALDARGWPGGGPPRPPLRPLNAGSREVVARALIEAGIDLGGAGP